MEYEQPMNEYLNLKTANCRKCYKCIRHCPVKSIRFDDNHAYIIAEDCILCGNCFVVCPQNAKEVRNDVEKARALLREGSGVYVSLAPSFTANYTDEKSGQSLTFSAMEKAVKELGFAGIEETAVGATLVKQRYDALVNAGESDVIISSCCHSVNQLIQKYYPDVLPSLAPVVSPMQAHCMDLKRRHPGAKTVFIGPCISKKAEAETYTGFADCALTFEELSQWLADESIALTYVEEETADKSLARFFPVSGGILRTMKKENREYAYLTIDGIENCIRAVEDVAKGKLRKCFIEMSACTGSCTGGPVMDRGGKQRGGKSFYPVRDYLAVSSYAGGDDFMTASYPAEALTKTIRSRSLRKIHLGETAVSEVLRKIGKTKTEHELNCGTCGYNTCREKAQAVLEGKASLFMCLPYLLEKAESFSDDIIKNTPNGIIVLNENFEVHQINAAACKLLNIDPPAILGDQVIRILDPAPFIRAVQEEKNAYNKRVYLADYEKYVDETVIYDKNYHIIICIMRDVTEETRQKEMKENFNRKAVDITDKVIEKQMRAVQEIASLLGETTAETKIALTKLKESLL
ncbi:MAG: 4Fe-4S dicluster domain-containing protein [Treponema sp.]|nr:4Fe-4S dicluster domain-containing protein [Treponema sp.]